MNLNQVTVPTIDYHASVDFYTRLGLKQIVDSPPRYARFECPDGESTLSIHAAERSENASGVVIYFECEALDATVASLRSAGLTFSKLPTDEVWLWREARLRDPSGNEICLFWAGENRKNPPWKIAR